MSVGGSVEPPRQQPREPASRREQLERSLERDQRELEESVRELKLAAQGALSLGDRVSRQPYLWFGACFAIGFWLGRR